MVTALDNKYQYQLLYKFMNDPITLIPQTGTRYRPLRGPHEPHKYVQKHNWRHEYLAICTMLLHTKTCIKHMQHAE